VKPVYIAISETSRTTVIAAVHTSACRRIRPSHAPSKRQKPAGSSRSPKSVGSIIGTNVAPPERRRDCGRRHVCGSRPWLIESRPPVCSDIAATIWKPGSAKATLRPPRKEPHSLATSSLTIRLHRLRRVCLILTRTSFAAERIQIEFARTTKRIQRPREPTKDARQGSKGKRQLPVYQSDRSLREPESLNANGSSLPKLRGTRIRYFVTPVKIGILPELQIDWIVCYLAARPLKPRLNQCLTDRIDADHRPWRPVRPGFPVRPDVTAHNRFAHCRVQTRASLTVMTPSPSGMKASGSHFMDVTGTRFQRDGVFAEDTVARLNRKLEGSTRALSGQAAYAAGRRECW
jgi:hypothetical protein